MALLWALMERLAKTRIDDRACMGVRVNIGANRCRVFVRERVFRFRRRRAKLAALPPVSTRTGSRSGREPKACDPSSPPASPELPRGMLRSLGLPVGISTHRQRLDPGANLRGYHGASPIDRAAQEGPQTENRASNERDLPLPDGFCRVTQRLAHVFALQIRVGLEDLLFVHAVGDHPHHRRNGYVASRGWKAPLPSCVLQMRDSFLCS